jgi:PHD/YefM family antitoxin component YafN of YafNO toxin-antitoxin module
METTNALQLRRSLGRVLSKLERDGKPILIEKGRKPKAVLISLRDYNERFVDAVAADERERLAQEILSLRRRVRRSRQTSVELVRELRGPLP